MENTKSPFTLLLNPSKLLFRRLGIRQQFKTVVSIPIIMGFVEKWKSGIPPPSLYEGDDLLMMGADIIVDQDGKLLYVFHQEKYFERPNVEDLFVWFKQ